MEKVDWVKIAGGVLVFVVAVGVATVGTLHFTALLRDKKIDSTMYGILLGILVLFCAVIAVCWRPRESEGRRKVTRAWQEAEDAAREVAEQMRTINGEVELLEKTLERVQKEADKAPTAPPKVNVAGGNASAAEGG